MSTSFRLALQSLDDDLAVHSRLIVAGDEAGELEFPDLGEPPKQLPVVSHRKTLCVWIVMLHVGKFLHQLPVLAVVRDRGEHEFVAFGPAVFKDKADLLALAHGDRSGLE